MTNTIDSVIDLFINAIQALGILGLFLGLFLVVGLITSQFLADRDYQLTPKYKIKIKYLDKKGPTLQQVDDFVTELISVLSEAGTSQYKLKKFLKKIKIIWVSNKIPSREIGKTAKSKLITRTSSINWIGPVKDGEYNPIFTGLAESICLLWVLNQSSTGQVNEHSHRRAKSLSATINRRAKSKLSSKSL